MNTLKCPLFGFGISCINFFKQFKAINPDVTTWFFFGNSCLVALQHFSNLLLSTCKAQKNYLDHSTHHQWHHRLLCILQTYLHCWTEPRGSVVVLLLRQKIMRGRLAFHLPTGHGLRSWGQCHRHNQWGLDWSCLSTTGCSTNQGGGLEKQNN